MTTFEIIFFNFVVCPVITSNIRQLLNDYKSNKVPIDYLDPSPMILIEILNEREYNTINKYNFNSYMIIVIMILLLLSLLFYLYIKIDYIESSYDTNNQLETYSERMSSVENQSNNTSRRSIASSQNSNYKKIYMIHGIKCAIATILYLIFFQVFFYNYGLNFKYIGTKEEMLVLIIESMKNNIIDL